MKGSRIRPGVAVAGPSLAEINDNLAEVVASRHPGEGSRGLLEGESLLIQHRAQSGPCAGAQHRFEVSARP